MLSFITPANPNPGLPSSVVPSNASESTLSPPIAPPGALHNSSSQSLSPSARTVGTTNIAASISSTDPIDVEKNTSSPAPGAQSNPTSFARYTPGLIPAINTCKLPPFLSTLVVKVFGQKDRRYFGIPRDTFIATVFAVIYILLAAVLGIGIGYMPQRYPPGYNKNDPQTSNNDVNIIIDPEDTTDLPLPTSGSINSGEATYYNPALGSCGMTSTDNDPIVAISMVLYDAASTSPNPNNNPLCGRKIRATRYRPDILQNITIEAMVVDRCVACAPNDLDLSPYLFEKIANLELGRVDITWAWL
ncbi:RlpA-like double-psi beta-barrel-protein domain-containing protein-containing protein [Kalaharituber pfeilii]|nr:RlpA-like double-psi beta-barrel-protein domain-containing protein-containing protein [Kalaharituber pfeilii]